MRSISERITRRSNRRARRVVVMLNINLDDRLFVLQNSSLPSDLSALVHRADVAYLQDRDDEAEQLVAEVEFQCLVRGIRTHRPDEFRKA